MAHGRAATIRRVRNKTTPASARSTILENSPFHPEAPLKRSKFLSIPVILCLLAALASPQRGHMPTPPESLDPKPPDQEPAHISVHVDLNELQKEADDLARTAQSIPTDVASVRKGTLPKDMIQKLRQIEKLSKHLRSQINP
jgi:hypothetical protein